MLIFTDDSNAATAASPQVDSTEIVLSSTDY